ncbi:hypothetical protein FRB93_006730 [Tulasnella sp. JGI-2019a]|nr:hypothetical protein FRB93_006730 [Tulasnella sp. JGI-2019a]
MFDWIQRLRLPRRSDVPPISYPITRDIHWKSNRVDPAVYLLAGMAFIILIPFNYALTGYETVTKPNPDYNYTQHHWYDVFTGGTTPGSLCDPYEFTVGDSFITNMGIFTYQMMTVYGDGGTSTTFSYTGQTLEECDVAYISAVTDAQQQASTVVAYIACTNEAHFPVVFTTSVHLDASLQATQSVIESALYPINQQEPYSSIARDMSVVMQMASIDLIFQTYFGFNGNSTGPSRLSAEAFQVSGDGYPPWWCTPSVFKTNSTCTTAVPPILDSLVGPTLRDTNSDQITRLQLTDYSLSINIIMQAMLAAIRIDMGSIFPNNFIVHRSSDLIGKTISPTLPVRAALNLASVSPSQITLKYQCQVKQRKSAGSLFIDVTVATLTLFNNSWGIAMWLLILVALWNSPEGRKSCASNEALEARVQDLERQLCVKPSVGSGDLEASHLLEVEEEIPAPKRSSSSESLPKLG